MPTIGVTPSADDVALAAPVMSNATQRKVRNGLPVAARRSARLVKSSVMRERSAIVGSFGGLRGASNLGTGPSAIDPAGDPLEVQQAVPPARPIRTTVARQGGGAPL